MIKWVLLLAIAAIGQEVDSTAYQATIVNVDTELGTGGATPLRKYCLEVVSGWRPRKQGNRIRMVYDSAGGFHGFGELTKMYRFQDTIVLGADGYVLTGKKLCLRKDKSEQAKAFIYIPVEMRRRQADTLQARLDSNIVYHVRVINATERVRIQTDDTTFNDRPIGNINLISKGKR